MESEKRTSERSSCIEQAGSAADVSRTIICRERA